MTAKRIGFVAGLAAFLLTLALPAPARMPGEAWLVAGLVVWMAAWWMTEAIPLTATALLHWQPARCSRCLRECRARHSSSRGLWC